jgi:hypothetical protein
VQAWEADFEPIWVSPAARLGLADTACQKVL